MKKLLWILTAVSVLLAAVIAFISTNIADTLQSERNARQTAPARAAKLAKSQVQEPVTNTSDEKEQQVV